MIRILQQPSSLTLFLISMVALMISDMSGPGFQSPDARAPLLCDGWVAEQSITTVSSKGGCSGVKLIYWTFPPGLV
eukprot:6487488-Amphidinium_carterae.4